MSRRRYIDFLKDRIENPSMPREAVTFQIIEISVDYTFEDGLSISWMLPPEYSFLCSKDIFVDFELTSEDGTTMGGILGSFFEYYFNGIRAEPIIESLIIAYPDKPNYIRCICRRYNEDYTKKEEWYFNIDISNINVVIEGKEIKPGTFKHFVDKWVPETITLADGQRFKANAYYLITSYNHEYRKPEYNSVRYAIFKVKNDIDIINNKNGKLNLNSGGLYLEDMHLREILIKNNANAGFTLFVTPESKEIFTIKKGSKLIY